MSAPTPPGASRGAAPLERALKTDPAGAATLLHQEFEAAVQAGAAGTTENLDCRPGCSHCCFGLVTVRAAEIFRLARAIRALSAEASQAIAQRVVAIDRVTRGRSVAERARDRVPCPLLGSDGGCLVYEQRPLACRVFVSLDVRACKRLFAGFGDSVPVPAGRLEAGGALLATFDRACRFTRTDGRPYELVAGLAIVLADDQAEANWIRGRDVLAPARGPAKTLSASQGPTVRL